MPAKYAHAKKRINNGLQQKSPSTKSKRSVSSHSGHAGHRNHSPLIDRSINQAITAVSELERAIARILLLRYEQDIGRLYSTRLQNITLVYLPKLVFDCIELSSPAWVAVNADSDDVKDFFRSAIAMDMRQAGERVATKSVLWSYTALRHFAISNNVHVCPKRGLQSLRLLPYFPALKSHLDVLEAMPTASFTRPAHSQSLDEGLNMLLDDLSHKKNKIGEPWIDWRSKVRVGYERLVETLWTVSREFDVRGYGIVLREKLTTKWCDCGCSTDHLGGVCEKAVREEEEQSGTRSGKGREWDGRGSGVYGWQTQDEEDVWETELDITGLEPDECNGLDPDMTVGELMDWRYFKAESAKEQGNIAFRICDFETAIKYYKKAYDTEPELPHYQLNIAAAHLKLNNWMAAEKACNVALSQHRSSKGYWRRAKARRMLGRKMDAIKDLRAVLKLQPENAEALAELMSLLPTNSQGNVKTNGGTPIPPGGTSSGATGSTVGTSTSSSPPGPATGANSIFLKTKRPISLPFKTAEVDKVRLRITSLPLSVEMPAVKKWENRNSSNRKGDGLDAYQTHIEKYSYPTWDRTKVQRMSR